MKHLGYKYNGHKKKYYTDGHERPDVVDDRNNIFLEGYFEAELAAYRWVQIEFDIAKKISCQHKDFQLDTGHVYIVMDKEDSKTYHEYHVDTHPVLMNYVSNKSMGGDLSVRRDKN